MSGGENAPKAGPGWYPDPSQPGTVRYWDGDKWTAQRAPALPGSAESSPRARPTTRRFWLAAVAAVVVVAVIVVVALLAGGDGSNSKNYEMPSGSMEPNFKIGDDLIVDLDAAGSSDLSAGDVVAFYPPAGAESSGECGALVRGMQPVESGEACPRPTSQPSKQIFLKRIVA